MGTFELQRLMSYDEKSLIEEIKRVASQVPDGVLTVATFERISRVNATTLRRRFGGWPQALSAAGLAHRVNDDNRPKTKEQVIAELQRVAAQLHSSKLGRREFDKVAKIKSGAVTSTFGNWRAALEAASLLPTYIRKPSDAEFFENLLSVWTSLGRQPFYRDMTTQPSRISGKAYVRRWGSWMKTLHAFVEAVEEDKQPSSTKSEAARDVRALHETPNLGPREPPLALRYKVLRRDRFRCVLCGASPATRVGCQLHIDHIRAYSRGGPTVLENLRTTCLECNLGKGAKDETDV